MPQEVTSVPVALVVIGDGQHDGEHDDGSQHHGSVDDVGHLSATHASAGRAHGTCWQPVSSSPYRAFWHPCTRAQTGPCQARLAAMLVTAACERAFWHSERTFRASLDSRQGAPGCRWPGRSTPSPSRRCACTHSAPVRGSCQSLPCSCLCWRLCEADLQPSPENRDAACSSRT